MYPSTTIEIVDKSQYQRISVAAINKAPTFMAAFAADRGTEDLTLFTTSDSWHDMYGDDISFRKYGQALKQAAMVIDNGGKLYSRRVVAADAKLPNLAVFAKVTAVKSHTDSEDNIVPGTVTIEYSTISAPNCDTNDMNVLVNKIESLIPQSTVNNDTSTSVVYLPLFVFAAMGRGTYSPRFRITPSYRFSRSAGYSKCLLEILGNNNNETETMYFSVDPYKIEKGASISLDSVVTNNSSKVRLYQWDENIDELYDLVGTTLDLTEEEKKTLLNGNLYFNTDLRGNRLITKRTRAREQGETDASYAQVPYVFNITNTSGFNFQAETGNKLLNGSNGGFGDAPALETHSDSSRNEPLTPYELYAIQLEKVFSEPEYSPNTTAVISGAGANDIFNTDTVSAYNIDSVAIDFIVDANYPEKVKNKIEELVAWRQDTFFIRDMGLNIKNLSDVEAYMGDLKRYHCFTSIYCNSMDVLDDTTMKYITVTIPYLMIPKLIQHYIDGINRPFAGIRYGIYWIYGTRIRKGSINFLPKVTPSVDEKEVVDNLGVNYVSILQGNKVTIETLYTTQHYHTTSELCYSCNIMEVQKVIKTLREKCPISRYAFATGADLENYQTDLLRELKTYESEFLSFKVSYAADATYIANKIYYAILEVGFKGFFQAEKFRIVAFSTSI